MIFVLIGCSFAVKKLYNGNVVIWFQIHEEARKFSYQTGVRVVVAYGGAPINQQVFVPSSIFVYS